jgi:hypothetical protein
MSDQGADLDVARYLTLVTEEYRTLRDESTQATINMFAALQWGSAIIGVVTAAGLTQWNEKHGVVLLVFAVVIPALALMTMFLWLGEAARLNRAGDYLCFVERKVGLLLGVPGPIRLLPVRHCPVLGSGQLVRRGPHRGSAGTPLDRAHQWLCPRRRLAGLGRVVDRSTARNGEASTGRLDAEPLE